MFRKIFLFLLNISRAQYEEGSYRDSYQIPDYYDEIFGIGMTDNFSSYEEFAALDKTKNCKERLIISKYSAYLYNRI